MIFVVDCLITTGQHHSRSPHAVQLFEYGRMTSNMVIAKLKATQATQSIH